MFEECPTESILAMYIISTLSSYILAGIHLPRLLTEIFSNLFYYLMFKSPNPEKAKKIYKQLISQANIDFI